MTARTGNARTWLLVSVVLVVLTVFVTWPQAITPAGVNDFGDPLLNSWALAWVAHAVHTRPFHLFDANMFFPEASTLAYSESLIVPGLVLAPWLWAGLDPIVARNLVLISGYVLSGLTMFALAYFLTKEAAAAGVAAVLVAPLVPAYVRASRVVGERTLQDINRGSAELGDYRPAHPDNWPARQRRAPWRG